MSTLPPFVMLAIPEAARAGLADKSLELFGSVIRRVGDGTIAYHLQEGPGLAKLALDLLPTPLKVAQLGVKIVGEAVRYQQCRAILQGMEVLKQLGVANLALSGAGIGVTLATTALLAHKLNGIEQRIGGIEAGIADLSQKMDAVRAEQERTLMAGLRGLANLFAESWDMTDAGRQEANWRRVYQKGADLEVHVLDRAAAELGGTAGILAAEPHLDAFAFISGLRIAAQLASGEVESARALEQSSTTQLVRLTGGISLADLVLRATEDAEPASSAWEQARADATGTWQPLVSGLRHRERLLATRTAMVPLLERQGLAMREFLQMARGEGEAPVLLLADEAG